MISRFGVRQRFSIFFCWLDICMMKDNVDVLLWGELSQILFKYVQMVKNNTINVENASEILRKSS